MFTGMEIDACADSRIRTIVIGIERNAVSEIGKSQLFVTFHSDIPKSRDCICIKK